MDSQGAEIQTTYWRDGEPNNSGNEDCLHGNYGTVGTWNDLDCNGKLFTLCKFNLSSDDVKADVRPRLTELVWNNVENNAAGNTKYNAKF